MLLVQAYLLHFGFIFFKLKGELLDHLLLLLGLHLFLPGGFQRLIPHQAENLGSTTTSTPDHLLT